MAAFGDWFAKVTNYEPRPWQERLAGDEIVRSRTIRIPTGLGKTLGVLAAWAYHRLKRKDGSWPRRLVWCLPMRVLTEQTAAEAEAFLEKAGFFPDVGVRVLMGGHETGDWHLFPERENVLVGTQDMLLSRALNRGYASARARWPMEFGLLSQDSLWVFDEIQLMDVGLATAGQLQAYRDDDADKHLRPIHTWWMSATLQNKWLHTVDTSRHHATWCEKPMRLDPQEQIEGPCSARKRLSTLSIASTDKSFFAEKIIQAHAAGEFTLVVCNTVERACETYDALLKMGRTLSNLRLVHSRFRPADRASWRNEFLSRETCHQNQDLIVVATQVVEAGVDISAHLLITELAPWPSLVQRFGRCARHGGDGRVLVINRGTDAEKDALPYSCQELSSSWEHLLSMDDVGSQTLDQLEDSLPEEALRALYPFAPSHLFLRREYDELFDTTPDLTGADLDIGRFIRSGEELDCYVCWETWERSVAPDDSFQPHRDALCPVPVHRARQWIQKGRDRLLPQVFDYVENRWHPCRPDRIRPGIIVLVQADGGGYDPIRGFTGDTPRKKAPHVPIIPSRQPAVDALADKAQDREDLSVKQEYQSISAHNYEVARAVSHIAAACSPQYEYPLQLAARMHDWGKVHPAFRGCIKSDEAPDRPDLAKAPRTAWLTGRQLYSMGDGQPRRPGFRHELASVLAMFELLARRNQRHQALLGPLEEVFTAGAMSAENVEESTDSPIAGELAALDANQFNLVCHLVASHHGKLRASWHACPQDQDYPVADERGLPVPGVREGDRLPALPLPSKSGQEVPVPSLDLHLAPANMGLNKRYGASWRERSLTLQNQFGPAALAYLEALLRAADIRVSRGENQWIGGPS